ncbi:unnamed protein product [Lampetra fluviatilis]
MRGSPGRAEALEQRRGRDLGNSCEGDLEQREGDQSNRTKPCCVPCSQDTHAAPVPMQPHSGGDSYISVALSRGAPRGGTGDASPWG